MGCLASRKLEGEEAVRLCRERKNYIKKAVEHRRRLVSAHVAYIESLRRVSAALTHYVRVDDRHDQFLDSFAELPLRSMERRRFLIPAKNERKKSTARIAMNCLKSGRIPSIPVEEEPEQEEMVRIDSSPANQSPRTENIVNGDDEDALRRIREAEGIPELEEDVDDEDDRLNPTFWNFEKNGDKPKAGTKHAGVQFSGETSSAAKQASEEEQDVKEPNPYQALEDAAELEARGQREAAGSTVTEAKTPTFTVHATHRPTSTAGVMAEMEKQFARMADCAHWVLATFEGSRTRRNPAPKEPSERTMTQFNSSCSNEDDGKSRRYYMEESCTISANHQSTLDRLYEWEKKLYEEVKSGEGIRMAYEKKRKQFKGHDINGEDPCEVEKTRATMRGLHTQLAVYLSTIESICKRIEALRDLKLCPQLTELICGLGQMWKTLAICHEIQKRTIEEAKVLFFGFAAATPPKSPLITARLVAEIHNWGRCLEDWLHAQRSYSGALSGWVSSCTQALAADAQETGSRKSTFPNPSPGLGGEVPPACGLCLRWSRLLNSLREARALEGVEFFAAGMSSVSAQQRDAAGRTAPPSLVEVNVSDMGQSVLWAGMLMAMGSMAEFAGAAAESYRLLVRKSSRTGLRWEGDGQMSGFRHR